MIEVFFVGLISEPWFWRCCVKELGVFFEIAFKDRPQVQILIPTGTTAGRGLHDLISNRQKYVPHIVNPMLIQLGPIWRRNRPPVKHGRMEFNTLNYNVALLHYIHKIFHLFICLFIHFLRKWSEGSQGISSLWPVIPPCWLRSRNIRSFRLTHDHAL